ncbi:MAG: TIGR00282 family metallophosphoesterase [Clostridia bacterium]|nr:TIGR00282 family metallophosphoesterase [Clostridia bacterium]
MRILFIGDIVGRPGREYLTNNLGRIKKEYKIDMCIANGENASHGKGITLNSANELNMCGVDVITLGNHWTGRDMTTVFDDFKYMVRPANFPQSLPGEGSVVFDAGKARVGVINVQGRIYLDPLNSPFEAAQKEIKKIKDDCDIIFVDFHAEATSEKAALAYFLDGCVCAVVGTHTHVQTADEKILKGGTAFISDIGMTGVEDSILGVKSDIIVNRLAKHISGKFELAEGGVQFNAVVVEADEKTGKAISIERINIRA